MNTNIVDRLEKLQGPYGRGQELPDILEGLNIRLSRACELYGPDRTIKDILDDLIVRRTVLNHLIKLMSELVVTVEEAEEIRAIKRRWNEYLWNSAMEKRKAAA
jgi:hypothetical protein